MMGKRRVGAGRRKKKKGWTCEIEEKNREHVLCHQVSLCKSSNICLMHSLSPSHPTVHTLFILLTVNPHRLFMSQHTLPLISTMLKNH